MRIKRFMTYLNSSKCPGYGENLLHFDPDGFFRAMREFYNGSEDL
ncbi:MAG: hypothetical protein V2A70_06695 [Candidatus Omnitrophota bacterium]